MTAKDRPLTLDIFWILLFGAAGIFVGTRLWDWIGWIQDLIQ